MADLKKENKKYFKSVIQSVVVSHETERVIEKEEPLIAQFVDFLTKKANEISTFHAVESEIIEFLKNYPFGEKMDFTPICNKLLPLSPLIQKLAEMETEVKKIKKLPDRYNCHKAIEVCKKLAVYCVNEMKLDDSDKVTAALNTNTPQLLVIQKEFETEKQILSDIKKVMQQNAAVLNKFSASETELQQFVNSFPNERDTDLKTVKDHLASLVEINKKLVAMGIEAKKLIGLPDRYNCHKAVEVCKKMSLFCINEMKSSDYSNATTVLDANIPKLLTIQKEFEKENQIISDLVDETTKISTQIKDYANRFNKDVVYQHSQYLLSSVEQMKFSSFDNTKLSFQHNITDIKNVIKAFDNENKNTTVLRNSLNKNSHNLWKEDNEQLFSELDSIIKKGTEKTNFVLQDFHNRIQLAATKKIQDIENTKQQYKWLKRKRYADKFNKLIDRYITLSDFQLGIKSIRKSRGLITKLFEEIFIK